jgi:predicted MFS family arabinose efflux permease
MSSFSLGANITFVKSQWRFLLFGLLLAFFSSPGQTFFISLFSAKIRSELQLSHGDFGVIYAIGTLVSAAVIIFLGRLVDVIRLKTISLIIVVGLAMAAAFFSIISSVLTLALGVFFLRLTGQGMMSHLYATAMSRRYVAERGRAVAIATQGHPLSEVIMPALILFLLLSVDWRQAWQITSILVLVIMVPACLLLSGRQDGQDGGGVEDLATGRDGQHWTSSEVVFHWRFMLLAGLVLAPAFTSTGLFFHQIHFADTKGISLIIWTGGYPIYAVCSIFGSLIGGMMVDRFSAINIASPIVMALSLPVLMLGWIEPAHLIWVYFAIFGLVQGAVYAVVTPIWAELYGSRYLGSIKAIMHAMMVFASALSPAGIGLMIDAGYSLAQTLMVLGAVPILAGILGYFGTRPSRP